MNYEKQTIFDIVLALLHVSCLTWLQAGVIPGRWEKVDALANESPVIVVLKQGDRIEGRLRAIEPESITVEVEPGRETVFEKRSIRKVMSAKKKEDSTRNGTLIGAGVGFGVGFGTMVAVEKSKTASGFRFEEESVGFALLGGAVGSAIGALAGWAIDKSNSANEVLYRAP